jgi:hypothetical protein
MDSAVINDDGLVFLGWRAGAIENPDVFKRYHGRVHGNERLHAWSESRLRPQRAGGQKQARLHTCLYIGEV